MDLLSNLNTLISVVVGIFGIGGYIFAGIAYLRNKVTSSQQKQQTALLLPLSPPPAYQMAPRPLSKLDWMEVLWGGFEDSITVRGGIGVAMSGIVGFFGGIILNGTLGTQATLPLVVFYVLFVTLNLLFYVYFVGRRVEKKVAFLQKSSLQKSKRVQTR